MNQSKIVVVMGSTRDKDFADRIPNFLIKEGFSIICEVKVASAHRTTRKLLQLLQEYNEATLVYITIAGLSDSLSGVVAGNVLQPVIACPPDLEKYGWSKAFSSLYTPRGVPVTFVAFPENAALAGVRILSFHDEKLKSELQAYKRRLIEKG